MNTKQKIIIGLGLAAVVAMALYPPWVTWCAPIDHPTYQSGWTHQYGWIFGRLAYPECAEKFPWTWGLATDRLLLQWTLVIVATAAVAFTFRRRTA